ncbi:hypothetical protein ACWEQ4_01265 [Rhodococcus sp. NPDC003994]
MMLFNNRGRAKVAAAPADYPLVTGALASNGATVVADVSDASTALVSVGGGTAFAGVAFVFEGTVDGTNWFLINASRTSGNSAESAVSAISATPTYAWRVNVIGTTTMRVRATGFTSGSLAVRIQPSSAGVELTPVNQVTSVSTTTPTPVTNTLVSTASTNAQNWAGSARTLFEMSVFNPTAATVYAKLYNKATAPTVGTDVPLVTLPVPAGQALVIEFGRIGKRFGTGLGFALTAGAAATDTAAAGAGVQINANSL